MLAKKDVFCYTSVMSFFHLLCRAVTLPVIVLFPLRAAAQGGVMLLEPIGNMTEIPANGGFSVFTSYFNEVYPWIVGMGAAVAVLMGLVGGIQIMQAGNDEGKVTAGRTRLLMSMGGLLLLLFSSAILNVLNPSFFKF